MYIVPCTICVFEGVNSYGFWGVSAKHETSRRWKKKKLLSFLSHVSRFALAPQDPLERPQKRLRRLHILVCRFFAEHLSSSFRTLVKVSDVISFVRLTARDLSVRVYLHDLFTQGKVIIFVQDVMKYTYQTCLLTNSRWRKTPTQSVCVTDFIVNVLDVPFASPIAIYC